MNSRRRLVTQALGATARLAGLGSDPAPGSSAQFRARVESDIRKWKGLAAKAKLDS